MTDLFSAQLPEGDCAGAGSDGRPRFARRHNMDAVEGARVHLADDSVDLIVTDPPYGIEGDRLDRHYNRDESFVVDGYVEVPAAEYADFTRRWTAEAERVLRPGGAMYLVTGWTHLRDVLNALAETRLELVNHLVWKYNFGVFTRRKYVTSHYHILYCAKPGARPTFDNCARFAPSEKKDDGGSAQYCDLEDVWIVPREYKRGQERNKNELPAALLEKMLQYSSREGDLVVDFFGGGFSTARVAKGMNRNSITFEISKAIFESRGPTVDRVRWGERLTFLKTGKDDGPARGRQPWTEAELERLEAAYRALRGEGLTKSRAMERLQVDFERGRFAILNALKRRGL